MNTFIVESIDGSIVKLETPTKDFEFITLYKVTDSCNLQEGDCLVKNRFGQYEKDDNLTKQREKEINERFKKLFNK